MWWWVVVLGGIERGWERALEGLGHLQAAPHSAEVRERAAGESGKGH